MAGGYRRREPDLLLRGSRSSPFCGRRSRRTAQPAFDDREDFVERYAAAAVDLLIEKSRLLIIDGRCRQRHVVGSVGKLRDLGEEVFDGLADGRADHLPSPSAVVGLPHLVRSSSASWSALSSLGGSSTILQVPSPLGSGKACRITLNPLPDWCGIRADREPKVDVL
jgi:hypothetical protein